MNLTSLALLFITAVALTITSVQTLLTLLFRRRGRFFAPGPRSRIIALGLSCAGGISM